MANIFKSVACSFILEEVCTYLDKFIKDEDEKNKLYNILDIKTLEFASKYIEPLPTNFAELLLNQYIDILNYFKYPQLITNEAYNDLVGTFEQILAEFNISILEDPENTSFEL